MKDDIAKESHFFLLKLILFQVAIYQGLFSLVKDLANSFYMAFFLVFDIEKDIIQIYNHENVELCYYDFLDIFLKLG